MTFLIRFLIVATLAPMIWGWGSESYVLHNGCKLHLIEDLSLEKAAVTVTIHTGWAEDPQACPGMAHLIEHLLMGQTIKEKYSLRRFVQDHGGSLQARTYPYKTYFKMELDPQDFAQGVEALGTIFCNPDFTEELLHAERQAILEERFSKPRNLHEMLQGIQGDAKRIEKEGAMHWFEEHYAPWNLQINMKAPWALEELHALAEKAWGRVPWRDFQELREGDSLFKAYEGHLICLSSRNVVETLEILWDIPASEEVYSRLEGLAHRMQLPTQTSLFSILARKGLAYRVDVHADRWNEGRSLYGFSIELSSLGVQHYEEVAAMVFGALAKAGVDGLKPHSALFILKLSGENEHCTYEKIPEKRLDALTEITPLEDMQLPSLFPKSELESGLPSYYLYEGENIAIEHIPDEDNRLRMHARWKDPALKSSLHGEILAEMHALYLKEKIFLHLDASLPLLIDLKVGWDWHLRCISYGHGSYAHIPKILHLLQSAVASEEEWEVIRCRMRIYDQLSEDPLQRVLDCGRAFWHKRPQELKSKGEILESMSYAVYLDFCARAFREGMLEIVFQGGDVRNLQELTEKIAPLPITSPLILLNEQFAKEDISQKIALRGASRSSAAGIACSIPFADDLEGRLFVEILRRILSAELFHNLRQAKQHAYRISGEVEYFDGKIHFLAALQSGIHDHETLSRNLGEFLMGFFSDPSKYVSPERFYEVSRSICAKNRAQVYIPFTDEDFFREMKRIASLLNLHSIQIFLEGKNEAPARHAL